MEKKERLIEVPNETEAETTRISQAGRRFTYKLNVLQQPVRARACGSGAKSSADRRPVDPPPIVSLKVFEGTDKEQRDITFSMSANYFLFATLEQARPMAHGRVNQDSSRLTVLTGTPVAGMVCLDRPHAAGYFIFPDLSVRHEGKYRLSFSLYEELKDIRDDDKTTNVHERHEQGKAHVTHRLEVKSAPFVVFSAKKFPGLTESTQLSRVVAEQGCRVRIRRDVRMRRRDNKQTDKGWSDGENDDGGRSQPKAEDTPDLSAFPTPSLPATLEPSLPRPRSSSNASSAALGAFSLSRRPSQQDLTQSVPQSYGVSPQNLMNGYEQSSPNVQSPSPQYAQNLFPNQTSSMQPPTTPYQPLSYHPTGPPPPPPPPPPSLPESPYHTYAPTISPAPMAQSQFGPPSNPPMTYESQRYRTNDSAHLQFDGRPTAQYTAGGPLPPTNDIAPRPMVSHYTTYSQQPSYHQQHAHGMSPPMPQTSYRQVDEYNAPRQSYYQNQPGPRDTPLASSEKAPSLPPLNTQVTHIDLRPLEPISPASAKTQNHPYSSSRLTSEPSNKRQYGSAFDDRHQQEPMRLGARPDTPCVSQWNSPDPSASSTASQLDDDPNDPYSFAHRQITYKRSNGLTVTKAMTTS